MKIVKRLSFLLTLPFLISICSAIFSPSSPKTLQQNDKASQSVAPTKTKTPIHIVLIGTPTQMSEITTKKVPTETPTPVAIPSGIVNNSANLRSGPGTNFEIVGSIEANQSIEIIGSNSEQDWFQLVDETWIAAFLVTNVAMPIPTLPPTQTPTATTTPNTRATSVAEERARATATIQAYINMPPEGSWCNQNSTRGVCVGDFRYENEMSYTSAPSNGRYIAFVIFVKNLSDDSTYVSPLDVTFVMKDGRTFAYSSSTFSYWAVPFEGVEIAPGNSAQGGLVFLIPNNVVPWKVIYSGGWFESSIEVNLHEPPTPD